MTLLPQHQALIDASAISPEVAAARGYWSASTKAQLRELGFTASQQRVPALVLPAHRVIDPDGAPTLYQIRPDDPRRDHEGRLVKYDSPRMANPMLDVSPTVRPLLRDPNVPLVLTEGIRKADAAASRGLCCVDMFGVWAWRNGRGDLPDWESLALADRDVLVAFDSDVLAKSGPYGALRRLKPLLEARKARVRIIYLPPGDHGAKVGLDDYLAAGHSVDELFALAMEELRQSEGTRSEFRWEEPPYSMDAAGIYWEHETRDGPVTTRLANFAARVLRDVVRDDGQDRSFEFEGEVQLGELKQRGRHPIESFNSLAWVNKIAGSQAAVSPGMGLRDHCRFAIQLLSGKIPRSTVYTHSGWREIGGRNVYLHGGGAIGENGPVEGVEVDLHAPNLTPLRLPDPPQDPREEVAASLDVLRVAPYRLTVPVLVAAYRAAIGEAPFSLSLYGGTGRRKTTLAELAMQHFGAGFGGRPPTSWEATANALEAIAFAAKDALLLVDDYTLDGTPLDRQRRQQAASRLFRDVANRTARDRLHSDTRSRPPKIPRCLPLSTAEELLEGRSLNARIVNLEVEAGDIPVGATLDRAQDAARRGVYAMAMAAFVRWLAPRLTEVRDRIESRTAELRRGIDAGHDRVSSTLAELIATWEVLLDFAAEVGVVVPDELREEGRAALRSLAEEQRSRQEETDPVGRFLDLLLSAIGSGRAHLASPAGGPPMEPMRWGWLEDERRQLYSTGERVGWVSGENVYLDPDAAYAVANRLASQTEQPLGATSRTLAKRLLERGLLDSHDHGRATVKVRDLQGQRRRILHLQAALFKQERGQWGRHRDVEYQNDGMPRKSGSASGLARSESGATKRGKQGKSVLDEAPVAPVAPVAPQTLTRPSAVGAHVFAPPDDEPLGGLPDEDGEDEAWEEL